MKRRDFVTLLGGAAVAWPIAARAQRAEQQKRLGVLAGFTDAEFQPRYTLFRDSLAQLGWTEPRNLRIDARAKRPALLTMRIEYVAGSS